MISDPTLRARALAELYLHSEGRLWNDLAECDAGAALAPGARGEWESFALYACVRGLVAAGGFNVETVAAVDALHDAVVERWAAQSAATEALDVRRARLAERYAEYGRIGQELEAKGAHQVTQALGEAAARHMAGGDPRVAVMAGELHEALAEGAAEFVRDGS